MFCFLTFLILLFLLRLIFTLPLLYIGRPILGGFDPVFGGIKNVSPTCRMDIGPPQVKVLKQFGHYYSSHTVPTSNTQNVIHTSWFSMTSRKLTRSPLLILDLSSSPSFNALCLISVPITRSSPAWVRPEKRPCLLRYPIRFRWPAAQSGSLSTSLFEDPGCRRTRMRWGVGGIGKISCQCF